MEEAFQRELGDGSTTAIRFDGKCIGYLLDAFDRFETFQAVYGKWGHCGHFKPLVVLLIHVDTLAPKVGTLSRNYCNTDGDWQYTNIRDVHIQRICARKGRRGHGTGAVLAVKNAAAKMTPARGIHFNATTDAGRALGFSLVQKGLFVNDLPPCNFYSKLLPAQRT